MDPLVETRLRELGLSDYQTRAYLALLRLGKTEAREVSRLGKVPIAKVYSTLQQLAERGLCNAFAETPRTFAPVPLTDFLERRQREHADEIEALARMREELAPMFEKARPEAADDRGTVTTVRGRQVSLDPLVEVLDRATERVLVIPSDGMLAGKAAGRLVTPSR